MAKCGMCKRSEQGRLLTCFAGHQVKGPTLVFDHDCHDYEYDESGEIVEETMFNVPHHDYCVECAHQCNGVCSGKRWIPYKSDPRCEFFRPVELTCKHAIPFIQYGNGLRNNKCSLRKDGVCCPWADSENNLDCYEPGYLHSDENHQARHECCK